MTTALQLAALVEARAASGSYTVLRGQVAETPAGAYVVLYFTGGHSFATRLVARPDRLRWTFRAVCVGESDEQALNTADLLRARFAGWRPLGPHGPQLVEVDDAAPLLRDDSVPNDVRFSNTLTFRLLVNVTPTPIP